MSNPKVKQETYALLGGINTKVSPYAQDKTEFLDLVNFDFTKPGALTKREGSTLYIGATVLGRITGLYEFTRLSGSSQIIVTANTNAYRVNGNLLTSFKSGLTDSALFDFTTFVDRMFACNGYEFFKYDLTNTTNFSLPPGATAGFAASLLGSGSGFTGIYIYSYGYLNDRGYLGPQSEGLTVSIAGETLAVLGGFTTPIGYGITAIAIYRAGPNSVNEFRIGWAAAGASLFFDTQLPITADVPPDSIWFTLAPKYIEIFNNQLFMAGFTSAPSTVWFSDIGEPESILPEYNFEVRTNDGDRITGLKTYNNQLMIMKENSYHALNGDNPDNFLLREISNQYGCISNRALVTYQNLLWFLDKKGLVQFNGANTDIVSDKVEPIFISMNTPAARDNASGTHVKYKNELHWDIPVNGSTQNNLTVVYDYLAQAYTKFSGYEPSTTAYMYGTNLIPRLYFGGYSGSLSNFGASLFTDIGSTMGMTLIARAPFDRNMGESIEKQYRRFYLNIDQDIGSTLTVNFRKNYQEAIELTRYIPPDLFQTRIDFGIPGKALSPEIFNFSNTFIRIYGYTIEMRFQRAV